MRFFSLRQTSRAVLLSMSASLALTLSAQAATAQACKSTNVVKQMP